VDWNWLIQIVRESDVNTDKRLIQWTLQGCGMGERPKNLNTERQTAGFKNTSRRKMKMEAEAQDKAGCRRVFCDLCYTGSDKISQIT